MPQLKKQPQKYFEVQAWQDAAEKKRMEPASSSLKGGGGYTVQYADLVVKKQTEAAQPSSSSAQPASGKSSSIGIAGEWRPKKRSAPAPEVQAVQTSDAVEQNASVPQSYGVDADAHGNAAPTVSCTVVERAGEALLAVLGGSRLVGNFSLSSGPSHRPLPLHGHQFTTYRDCSRDPEWSIVKLHLMGLPGLPREVVAVAECTGGDAMRLRAPVEWQNGEAEAAAAEMGELKSSEGLSLLTFDCHTLLDGAAADDELRRAVPGAVGLGAVVNMGRLKIRWERGSGGEDDEEWWHAGSMARNSHATSNQHNEAQR